MNLSCWFVLFFTLCTKVTGVSMQSVLVGEDLNGCAFVCGSLSFLDKISCGIALYILQSYQSKFTAPNHFLEFPFLLFTINLLRFSSAQNLLWESSWFSLLTMRKLIVLTHSHFDEGTASRTAGNLSSDAFISVTRFGLGLVPAFCSLLGAVTTYMMKFPPYASKPLVEPLLE